MKAYLYNVYLYKNLHSCVQLPAHAGSSLVDLSTLKMEAICSSETSLHIRCTRRHIPEDGILQWATYSRQAKNAQQGKKSESDVPIFLTSNIEMINGSYIKIIQQMTVARIATRRHVNANISCLCGELQFSGAVNQTKSPLTLSFVSTGYVILATCGGLRHEREWKGVL
jgi:hypothetical protein